MGNFEENSDRNSGLIFLIILSFLFSIVFSDKQAALRSSPDNSHVPGVIMYGNIPDHHEATILHTDYSGDFHKLNNSTVQNKCVFIFSIQKRLLYYDRRTARIFVEIQKERFAFRHQFFMKWQKFLPSPEVKEIPVLS